MKNLIIQVDRIVGAICRIGVVLGLIVVFGLLLVSILARPFGIQVSGYDEIVELSFIWITMLGVLALWRSGELYRVEFFDHIGRGSHGPRAFIVQLLMLIFLGVLIIKGGQFALFTNESTPFMRIPKIYFYSAIPICASGMAFYSLARMVDIFIRLMPCRAEAKSPLHHAKNGLQPKDV